MVFSELFIIHFLLLLPLSYCQQITLYPTNSSWLSILTTPQSAGTTITFRSGTYATSNRVHLTLNGLPGQPVIIQGYPGEQVIFLQQNPSGQNGMEVDGQNFVLQNFVIQHGSEGLRLGPNGNVSNALIQNIEIAQTQGTGLTCNQAKVYNNVTITGCYIHDTCYGVLPGSETGECMYLGSSPSCSGSCPSCTCTANSVFQFGTVEGNLCVNTTLATPGFGSGIQLKGGSTNNLIRNNVIYNTLGPGILSYGWNYSNVQYPGPNYIDGNVIWDSQNEAIQTGQGFVITNNIVFGSSHLDGIRVQPNDNTPAGVVILSNTVFSSNGGVIRMDGLSVGPGGFIVANNALFALGSASCFVFSDSSSVVNSQVTFMDNGVSGPVGYSSFTSPNATFTLRADTVELLNPNGQNFYPAVGSYLIDAASTQPQFLVSTDFNCNYRNSAMPTVGAYQYSTATNPGWQISATFKQCTNNSNFLTTGSTTSSFTPSTTNNNSVHGNALKISVSIWIMSIAIFLALFH